MRGGVQTGAVLAALAVAMLPGQSVAEPERVQADAFKLSGVLSAAITQNPDLALASIDIEQADALGLAARGDRDWVLAAQVNAFRQRAENVRGNLTGANRSDLAEATISISKLLPTGGILSLGFGTRRNDTVFAFSGDQAISFTSNLTARYDQPLLRNRFESASQPEVQRQERLADAARARRESQARSVLLRVIQAYWELAFSEESLKIRKSSLDLATSRKRLTQASVSGGSVPQSALTAVDQVITQREEDIALAELDILERSLDLRRVAGLDIGPNHVAIHSVDTLELVVRRLDSAKLLALAFEHSPEIAELNALGENATLDVQLTRRGLLPRLDLSLSAGPQAIETSFGPSVTEMLTAQGYALGGTLTFEMPLQNRSAEGNEKFAMSSLRAVKMSKRDIELQVASSVMLAISRVQSAQKRMNFSKRTIELAQVNIEQEQKLFDLGRATNFDVLERQDELKQAELRATRALVDHLTNLAQLDALTGRLFGAYGITWNEKS